MAPHKKKVFVLNSLKNGRFRNDEINKHHSTINFATDTNEWYQYVFLIKFELFFVRINSLITRF